MKWTFVISAFLLILSNSSCTSLSYHEVCFQNHCFNVELAQTVEEKVQGLKFREYLEPDKGMLFIFKEEGRYSFWMKDTLIPLDIIWINKDKAAVFIAEDIQPCRRESCPRINPNVRAKYVLELNARTTQKIGLSVGDKLEFDI